MQKVSVHRPLSKATDDHLTSEYQPFRGAGSSQKAVQPSSLQTYLEFHGGKSVEDFAHVLSDDGPRDLVVALGCGFYGTACHVIKCNHIGKHSHCFIERAEPDGTEKDLSGILEQLTGGTFARAFTTALNSHQKERALACFTPGIFDT